MCTTYFEIDLKKNKVQEAVSVGHHQISLPLSVPVLNLLGDIINILTENGKRVGEDVSLVLH